ncbi:carboxypeptidase-like regulatory domain-containing protein [Maribacter ulvicola]|uniref:CarboxypepD_reg-like domain-containing protein n=1 Tax=Maribacter ulvicola TaxID=228959 RepID=A0A1N6PZW1_9FLAO|nr:carboxypeptidase-like regulatory domain-containing protein [Maribacter ulvicola]SIQ09984.1 CarboxypepD_reg-like domain-containing protein [Maribacter ulvicola]
MNSRSFLLPLFTFLIFNLFNANAQSLNATVIDSVSQQPIPFASVQLKEKWVITNEEGSFHLIFDEVITEFDSLTVSSMGYETLTRPISEFTSTKIALVPKAIELREVIVSNKNYTADEIMDFVEDHLEKNYTNDLSKKRLFHRTSSFNRWTKSDFKVKKSSIDVLNQKFLDSIINTVPKNNSYYSEIVGDLYGNSSQELLKLDLLKASKLYDKSKELDAEKLEEKFNEILKENVKEGSYFKIKSGLFGTKIDAEEVSELIEEDADSTDIAAVNQELEKKKKDKEAQQKNYGLWKKRELKDIFKTIPTHKDSDLNFIYKTRKYDYTLQAFTYLGDTAVYVISFTPSRSADYEGTLYINADDFAVIQVDYTNVKPTSKFSLLGISSNNYLSKGKIIYNKGKDGYYALRYYESENAMRVGIRRPLKIIEKNKIVKGRNKQNELSGDMDFVINTTEKNEMIVFESEYITQATYDGFTENNAVSPTYMPKYDPTFWEGYAIMEPNTAIKEFTATSAE